MVVISKGENHAVKGSYSVINSYFESNSGVRVTVDPSSLLVNSCLFYRCFDTFASAISFQSINGNVSITKACGSSCRLISSGYYGIFYQIRGNQTVSYTSYSNADNSMTSRDTLNHEKGNKIIDDINITNIEAQSRGFGWFTAADGIILSHSIAHNITTANGEILNINNGSYSSVSYFAIIGRNSKSVNLFKAGIPIYLFRCDIHNNIFSTLFNGKFYIHMCDIEGVSTKSIKPFSLTHRSTIYRESVICNFIRAKKLTCKTERKFNKAPIFINILIIR